MLLHELLDSVDVLELRGDPRTEITSVTHDSRAVQPGALFCCVPGLTVDGHDHALAAVAAGAVAVLVERHLDPTPPPGHARLVVQVRVPSVRRAMGPLAAAAYGHPSRHLTLLGVTGTNGKTTTTYLLEAIARAAGHKAGVIGTIETRVDGAPVPGERTTPEAPELQAMLARMVAAGVGVAAIEVSSHALALHRVDGAHFVAACFTNLSHDHLDFHASLDDYFAAKASLFDPARTAAAAINLDDPYGARLAEVSSAAGLSVVGFGLASAEAVVSADDVSIGPAGTTFRLVTPQGTGTVASSLVGRFNLLNALGAAATALAAGLDLAAVTGGLSTRLVVPGRMERVDAGQSFPVLVDYAHTPDGLDQVLRAARPLTAGSGRLVVVFGCGGDRDRAKRPAMGKVAAALADGVWITSDNPRSEDPMSIAAEVNDGVAEAGGVAEMVLDRRLAIRAALLELREGDALVIAGKGHEPGQTAGGVTVPFDDRVVAREELERLGFEKRPGSAGRGGSARPAGRGGSAQPAGRGGSAQCA